MIVASVSVVASAAAADWTVGNGYNIIEKDGTKTVDNTPVTVADAANGAVSVSHGGYYNDGKNWGGVASTAAYNLNGLEFTVQFDQVPEVTAEDDCWISLDLLEKPQLFQVGDVPGNRGFMNLIRFGRPYWEIYEGVTGFSKIYDSQSIDNNAIFGIKTGDTVKLRVDYVDGVYQFTYTNGDATFVLPQAMTQLTDVFAEGKAHVVISASLKGAQADAFKYTIVSVTDGKEKTAEEKAAEAQAKADAEAKAAAEKAEREAKKAAEKAEKEAQKAAEEAAKAAEKADGEGEKATDEKTTDVAAPAEDAGLSTGAIVGIVIAVVVVIAVIVVVVVLSKKKKNSK